LQAYNTQCLNAVYNYLSLRATTGAEEAAAADAVVAGAGTGKAIDANVASIAFCIASGGCCAVFVPLAGPALCLIITYSSCKHNHT